MKGFVRASLLLATAVLTLGGISAPAEAQPTAESRAMEVGPQLVCGYNDNDHGQAVYRHCGNINVVIWVEWIFEDYYLCVKPGNTVLGETWMVYNAYYVPGGEWCHA